MGQVWRAQDLALQRPVAVKVLRSEYTGDPTFLARFRAEAQNAASLSHPNVAAVFDYGEETAQDGTGETLAYLVMELITGEPLSALLAREGALDTATTLSILRQTAFALGEAHRAGMVHRDVKPGNILVCPDGHVKITDFGIAWSARSVALTRTGQVIGTPQYLSPEQAEGRLATPASDVYGLGLIGYECLSGHPAFDGDNPVTIALKQVRQDPEPLPDRLPTGVRTLIGRAVAKDPSARFPDGAAFVAAIEDVVAGRRIPPAPTTQALDLAGAPVPSAATGDDTRAVRAAGGVVRPPAPRRRSAVGVVLVPLLGLLVGAGIAAGLITALADGKPAAPAAAAEQQQAAIVLKAADYVGRDVNAVTAELEALGLVVRRVAVPSPDAVPGMVTDVQPAGRSLASGDTVVVSYAGERSSSAATGGGGSAVTGAAVAAGGGDATTSASSSAATSSAAPTETTDPTTPSSLPASSTTSEATETSSSETTTATSSPTDTTEPSDPTTSATESSPSAASSTETAPPKK
jgi:serine/threonine-protein kinase